MLAAALHAPESERVTKHTQKKEATMILSLKNLEKLGE
jgi:hypothetical protein